MDPIKVAAGAGAAALVVGGTAYGIYNSIDSMPECDLLYSKTGFGSSGDYTNGKYGFSYGRYLVDPDKLENSKNKDWWEWAFRLWKTKDSSQLGKKFQTVSFSYKEDSDTSNKDKALNQICKSAYKDSKENILSPSAAKEDSKFQESDVWMFCSISPNRNKPILLVNSEDDTDKGIVGDAGSNTKWGKSKKDNLVSTRVKGNDWFWDLKDRELKSADLSSVTDTNNLFKKGKGTGRHVKQICQDAYNEISSNTTVVTEQNLKDYCYLEKTSN
ncbi:hypothetical protein MHSWG343_04590 [Candidatus Mycoplasma haematohominis]|uniref:Uncharacterized protein n=1 Tax=Candidatus Mycoplasma haematohominis TaxID=1494318 RepID=A0A478FQ88_9MOLU|nr:hypothetical protein MHSWG343_04590 [Candidatus Mycoplasma haemohominis]